jgi:uncharacterized protein YcbK (DUF882 family)
MTQRWWRRAQRAAAGAAICVVASGAVVALAGMSAPRHAVASVTAVADTVDPTRDDSVASLLPALLGKSGKLRVVQATPARVRDLPLFGQRLAGAEPEPGVHDVGLATPEGEAVRLVALIPFAEKRGARLQGYNIGFWPTERGRRSAYDTPEGFIEVTADNRDTPLSQRFRMADFLTHDQHTVWPKLLVVRPTLLDKLELIADELARMGKPSELRVMSGFRTPQYNARGVCKRCGRARDSRHMYGDAADVFVDADGDGRMDDLDGDGRVTIADARFLGRVAERVELDHPELVGGIGIYKANRAHGPFVHVDTRGTPARW